MINKKINYARINKLLLPGILLLVLLCWLLAFRHTYDAIQLNKELQSQSPAMNDISFNPQYVQRKLTALQSITKTYRVQNAEEWGNQLWMKASAAAMKLQVEIAYTKKEELQFEKDSLPYLKESLSFDGHFLQLIKLIDTLENSRGIGKIASLKLIGPKEEADNTGNSKSANGAANCRLDLEFRAIIKENK